MYNSYIIPSETQNNLFKVIQSDSNIHKASHIGHYGHLRQRKQKQKQIKASHPPFFQATVPSAEIHSMLTYPQLMWSTHQVSAQVTEGAHATPAHQVD